MAAYNAFASTCGPRTPLGAKRSTDRHRHDGPGSRRPDAHHRWAVRRRRSFSFSADGPPATFVLVDSHDGASPRSAHHPLASEGWRCESGCSRRQRLRDWRSSPWPRPRELRCSATPGLGLGYNIDNDGGVLTETDDDGNITTPDDVRTDLPRPLRRQHDRRDRQRHHLRRDGSVRTTRRAARRHEGQKEGSVFVSGQLGHPDLRRYERRRRAMGRRRPGRLSLTGLGELDETLFISNGGDFGADGGTSFAATSSPVRRCATTSTSWVSVFPCRRTAT